MFGTAIPFLSDLYLVVMCNIAKVSRPLKRYNRLIRGADLSLSNNSVTAQTSASARSGELIWALVPMSAISSSRAVK